MRDRPRTRTSGRKRSHSHLRPSPLSSHQQERSKPSTRTGMPASGTARHRPSARDRRPSPPRRTRTTPASKPARRSRDHSPQCPLSAEGAGSRHGQGRDRRVCRVRRERARQQDAHRVAAEDDPAKVARLFEFTGQSIALSGSRTLCSTVCSSARTLLRSYHRAGAKMGSHSAKSRQESGGVWTVICPGKQHFANLLDSSRPARGLLHTEEVTGSIPVSPTDVRPVQTLR